MATWKDINTNEVATYLNGGNYVEYKTRKVFRNIRAGWNPVPDNHHASNNNEYRVLVKGETT
jgi:hypothetical protein